MERILNYTIDAKDGVIKEFPSNKKNIVFALDNNKIMVNVINGEVDKVRLAASRPNETTIFIDSTEVEGNKVVFSEGLDNLFRYKGVIKIRFSVYNDKKRITTSNETFLLSGVSYDEDPSTIIGTEDLPNIDDLIEIIENLKDLNIEELEDKINQILTLIDDAEEILGLLEEIKINLKEQEEQIEKVDKLIVVIDNIIINIEEELKKISILLEESAALTEEQKEQIETNTKLNEQLLDSIDENANWLAVLKEFIDDLQEKLDSGYFKGEKGDRGEPGTPGVDGKDGEKGEKGEPGEKGDPGPQGEPGKDGEDGKSITFEDLTPAQKEELKGEKGDRGEKGDKGEPFKYEDFTPEQLLFLKGEKGDPGKDGKDGEKGDKGDPFKYEDFTEEQLLSLKGEKGEKGDTGPQGEPGLDGKDGEKGEKGDPGPQGEPGKDGIDGKDGGLSEEEINKLIDESLKNINDIKVYKDKEEAFNQAKFHEIFFAGEFSEPFIKLDETTITGLATEQSVLLTLNTINKLTDTVDEWVELSNNNTTQTNENFNKMFENINNLLS